MEIGRLTSIIGQMHRSMINLFDKFRMDSRDWLYIKVFMGLYVLVTVAAALGGVPFPPWRAGVYGAVLGTLVFAVLLVGKEWVSRRTTS